MCFCQKVGFLKPEARWLIFLAKFFLAFHAMKTIFTLTVAVSLVHSCSLLLKVYGFKSSTLQMENLFLSWQQLNSPNRQFHNEIK